MTKNKKFSLFKEIFQMENARNGKILNICINFRNSKVFPPKHWLKNQQKKIWIKNLFAFSFWFALEKYFCYKKTFVKFFIGIFSGSFFYCHQEKCLSSNLVWLLFCLVANMKEGMIPISENWLHEDYAGSN